MSLERNATSKVIDNSSLNDQTEKLDDLSLMGSGEYIKWYKSIGYDLMIQKFTISIYN
jgi:hypothetical protein